MAQICDVVKTVESGPAFDRLGFDVSGNISNVGIAQFWAESRHAVLAIGHLIRDGFFMAVVVVGEIRLEIVLLERALTVHDVATSDVAGRAIGGKHLLTMGHICSGNHGRREQRDQSGQRERKKVTHG